ncbi:MAG TPA: alpha/beta hydrolase [Pyrinomonadaceae bacterium]|nr:alpha/beta hydrolase [Pyrinomonadaceae bacterium]
MPQAQVRGAQLYYEIQGEGEPLILIPGFGAGRWIWFKQTPALSEHFRVITFDPLGIARSSGGDDVVSMGRLADDVAQLLRSINVERAHVVGASFGGFVAQEFALSHPSMTDALILCCTSFGGTGHVPPTPETLFALASTKGLNTSERVRENLLLAFSREYVEAEPAEIEHVINLREANFVPEHVYLHQLQAAVSFDASARVHGIKARTLVITGDEDIIVPAENSRNLATRIPGARLRVIPGGSHTFFIEKADEFNRAVVEFISEPEGG